MICYGISEIGWMQVLDGIKFKTHACSNNMALEIRIKTKTKFSFKFAYLCLTCSHHEFSLS